MFRFLLVIVALSCLFLQQNGNASTPYNSDFEQSSITFPLLQYNQVKYRRALEEGEVPEEYDDEETNALQGPHGALYQGYGTHYVDIWVGHPIPKRQTLIVDTGSDITAFPCEPCEDCGHRYHTDEAYAGGDSITFQKIHCDECSMGFCQTFKDSSGNNTKACSIQLSYAEGSQWRAFEALDRVYLGGPHGSPLNRGLVDSVKTAQDTSDLDSNFKEEVKQAEERYHKTHPMANDYSFDLRFGCQTHITGLFKTQLADGIMGMEYSNSSFWNQMYDAKMIGERKFALCFSDTEKVDRDGTQAGAITLGGSNAALHKSPMIYADNVNTKTGWFEIFVTGIYLKMEREDEKEAKVIKVDLDLNKLNEKGIILDSGTTETYMPKLTKAPFEKAFEELLGEPFREEIENLGEDNPFIDYPSILIQMRGASNVDLKDLEKDGVRHNGLAGSLDPNSPDDIILEMPPTSYFDYNVRKSKFKNRLHMTEPGMGVLGANAMFDYDILFDVDGGRIGFAPSDCN